MRLARLLTLIFVVSSARAEDDSAKFFIKDYAKNPLEEADQVGSSSSEQYQQAPKSKIEQIEKSAIPSSAFKEVPSSNETLSDEPGRPIKWLGLIVSSEPENLRTQTLSILSKIARRHDLSVGLIYIVGKSLSIQDSQLLNELMIRGAQLKIRGRPPEEFGAKRSPTWIVELEKGEILLDGILDPTFFFNEKGEYLGDPEKQTVDNQ